MNTDTTFRTLCAELVEALDAELDLFEARHSALLDRARAALAAPEQDSASSDGQIVQQAWVRLVRHVSLLGDLRKNGFSEDDCRTIGRIVAAWLDQEADR